MKPDVKLRRWSSMRNLERTRLFNFRLSEREWNIIYGLSYIERVRPSDILRGALVYAGVISDPCSELEEPEEPAVGDAAVGEPIGETNEGESEVQS